MTALTYRPATHLAEALRTAAFRQRRSKQSILDEALTQWLARNEPAAPPPATQHPAPNRKEPP